MSVLTPTGDPVDPSLAALLPLLDGPAGTDALLDGERLTDVLALGLDDPARVQPRVAALLARLADELDVPVALVNGLLPDVQVLAGAHGLSGWLEEARATPVEWSLCADVVRTARPRVVPDLAQEAATVDNPLWTVDGLQAYAGVPLRAATGQVVGALCVLDRRPRDFTPEQVARLEELATAVLALLAPVPAPRPVSEH